MSDAKATELARFCSLPLRHLKAPAPSERGEPRMSIGPHSRAARIRQRMSSLPSIWSILRVRLAQPRGGRTDA